ncbi:MAG: hypothetical protein EPN93_12000 [Spirochaetes bacterium]|nr:MAG: hypothetical protein EPN93_12000 [Spirochaetota bacterium]
MKLRNAALIVLMAAALIVPSVQARAQEDHASIMLETIGTLSAQGVYLTYGAIGSVADGYAKKIYTKELTTQLLTEYATLSGSAAKQLEKLAASGALSAEDVGYVNKLVSTYNHLIAEANGYKNYVSTGKQEHVKVYSDEREKAWAAISDLLGLKK